MTTPVFFDIETGPLPEDQIRALMPEFEAGANLKDPVKIAAAIEAKKAKWLEDGALSAVTGEVLVIGTLVEDQFNYVAGEEKALLGAWWQQLDLLLSSGNSVIGFCCKTFDLPFLIRRSWVHGVHVPRLLFDGRYFARGIVDLAETWACGGRDPRDRISLDALSTFLGVGQKNGDGKDFATTWESDRVKALEYLRNDLILTQKAYERMTL